MSYTPSPLTMMFPNIVLPPNPSAPANIADGTGGTVGFRGLSITYDASDWPQQTYIQGSLGFVYNGGAVKFQGYGWYPASGGLPTAPSPILRQIVVDAQANTPDEANAASQRYLAYSAKAKLKGVLIIGQGVSDVGDFQQGQMVTITDPRLPTLLNGTSYPIQKVGDDLIPGQPYPVLQIEFGDAPFTRFLQKYRMSGATQLKPVVRVPANVLPNTPDKYTWNPGDVVTYTAQLVDTAKQPLRVSGLTIKWSFTTTDLSGGTVTGQGSLAASTSVTNADGQATNQLTIGSLRGLYYDVVSKLLVQS